MKQTLLYLFIVLGIARVQVSMAQMPAMANVEFNMFAGTALKTSSINNGDTVVFDLSQATCVGQYFLVPISVISDDVINAVDFSIKYNNNKITYNSVLNYKPAYLTPSANFNITDSILRFTSYSFVLPIEKNTAIAAARFNLINGPILGADFNTVKAYLNGDKCSFKFIAPILPTAVISPSGPTSIVIGDTVSLTANSGAGFTYLWSTASTLQTIKVFSAATYTVTVTNLGGCTANAATNVTVMTPLPITLLTFSVQPVLYGIEVNWVTVSESGNHFFTVERSSNGLTWKTIYTVNGTPNVNTTMSYSFVDDAPESGINYYRLRQTDFNGNVHFLASKSIISSKDQIDKPQLLTAPNPASGFVKILSSINTTAQLYNALGFSCLEPVVLKANQEVVINTSMFPNGVYTLKTIDNSSSLTSKIIILNK